MRIEIDRWTIRLIPESRQDVAFIEDTMGLYGDGDEIHLERIDAEDEPFGFRLETDLPSLPSNNKKGLPHPSSKSSTGDTFKRPLDDFIDIQGSWDGPPYTKNGIKCVVEETTATGQPKTQVDIECLK